MDMNDGCKNMELDCCLTYRKYCPSHKRATATTSNLWETVKSVRYSIIPVLSGQVLNRFARDTGYMDDLLPKQSYFAITVFHFILLNYQQCHSCVVLSSHVAEVCLGHMASVGALKLWTILTDVLWRSRCLEHDPLSAAIFACATKYHFCD